jgi:hypothetical protein
MDGKHIDTVVRPAETSRRFEATVRRRWVLGPGALPGRRLVLKVVRPERRDR